MISFYKGEEYQDSNVRGLKGGVLIEIACLSSDTKPTEKVANGSLCLEMDTGKIYAFNETASAWVEVA